MKKLISKNPVKLFKTGIRFAQRGTSLNMSRLYRRSDGTYTTVDGTVVGYWKGKRLGISGLAWKYLAGKYGIKYANNANANMVNGNIYQGGKWRANYEPSGNKTADWKTATGGKTPTSFKDKRYKDRTVEFNISRNKPLLKASTQKGSSAAQRLITANNSSLLINGQFLRIAASRKAEIKQNNNGNYYFDTTLWYPSRKSLQLRIFANGDIYNLSTGQLEDTNKLIRSEYVDRTMPQIATTGWGAKRYRDSQGNIVDSNGEIVYSVELQKEKPYTVYGRKPGGFGPITIDPEIGRNYYSNPQNNTETYLNNPGLFVICKQGGKLKVKMADGSGTITIDTPDKDQLAGRKPVGKTKDGENLYLNGDGKVVKHDSKEGSEQTNWMEKGGITKHQRGAKFMGTGVQRGWTSSYGNNLWNGITADLKLALIGTGKFTEDSFKDARSLQTALNKYFEGNAATMNNRDFTASRIAVDNKWGDLSLKALMHALSMANYDEARPLNVSNVNPVNGPLNGMSTIPTKIEARPEHMYNRAEVRQLLRNQGINPYSLSGALRQAIRFALNGGHKYNKALLQGIDLKRLTQPDTVGNKETSTFNTPPASNPGTITYTASINNGNMSIPTIQIKDPGHIPTVSVAKLGGRLISKDPVKLFKLGGSIAKYGLGDRMKSYVKKKKSELNRAKAAANNWSGYELTYPEFTQNGIVTKGVVSGRNYVPEATVTASKEGARKSRLNEASQRNASLAKMQDTLFRIGAYDRNKTLYRQAVDGLMGGLTRNAIKRAREMGYEVNEKTGEIKKLNRKGLVQKATDLVHNINEKMKSVKGPVENPRKNNMFEMLYTPGTTPNYILKIMNDQGQQIAFANPALALLNRKLHGALGISANYTAIPEDLREILSDQNLYIYDNWSTVFSNNLGVARNTLSTNLAALAKAKKENNTKEIEKLTKEIENNKKSIETISNNYNEVRKAGGLEKWLKANPGKKMIIGANFAHYKRANRTRFPQGTPSGYANFDKPNYINYAMKTPLGRVENIFGNNVQSFMYDPEQDVILTRASDTYDFNPRGSSAEGPTVSKLREAVGNDKTYTDNGSVKYSFDLKPIRPGESNYTTRFGESQPNDYALSKALVGLGIKLHL